MKKRVLSLLIALCLVVGLCPGVFAATLDNGLEYEIEDDHVKITGYIDNGTPTEFVIPSEIEGLPVTAIGNFAFNSMDRYKIVTGVTIPDSVTSIGRGAFSHCDALTSIIIPEGVTIISNSTFWDCDNLENVTIPSTVTAIDDYAFYTCISLKSIVIPDGVTSLGEEAFSVCSDLTSIAIPASVTDVGWAAFNFCNNLTDVYYGGSEEQWNAITIGSRNDALQNATIHYNSGMPDDTPDPDAVSGTWGDNLAWDFNAGTGTLTISGQGEMATSYEDNATDEAEATDYYIYPWDTFQASISTVVLEEGVATIATGAFETYQNLTEVSLPSTLTYIAWGAFYESGLVRVELPDSVTGLGVSAFGYCEQLEYVKLPAGLESSGEGPFAGCTKLSQIVMPKMPNLEFFGSWFFEECDALTNLDFFTAPRIDQEMFWGCSGLEEIRLPETVTTVSNRAFYQCENLTKVTIPGSIQVLGSSIFSGCDKLTEIWFEGDAPENYDPLSELTATAYYPANNDTWTEEVRTSFKGNITWVPYIPNPFTDVPAGSFYEEPVLWAIAKGITNGLTATEFGPAATCNRAQVVTFLWRAAGSPEPTSTRNPFVDVQAGSFYEKPVLWAVEKGITNGSDATHFGPTGVCNRAQVVTFLYRAFGSPAVSTEGLPFTDVPAGAWYEAPIAWAVENGVTNGLSATEFGPAASCNRAQVVTFLYRAYND